jgi:hypothetical protein
MWLYPAIEERSRKTRPTRGEDKDQRREESGANQEQRNPEDRAGARSLGRREITNKGAAGEDAAASWAFCLSQKVLPLYKKAARPCRCQ